MSDLISRADALDALEGNKSDWDNDYNRPIDKDIQALKALPSAETTGALDDAIAKYVADGLMELPSAEAKGDLISRQWLLDLYATPKDGDDVEWKVPLEVVRQNILDAPSAEAVQGEWIITKEGEYDGRSVYKTVCSECGHETFYKANKAHFCPNCGARMKGGDAE